VALSKAFSVGTLSGRGSPSPRPGEHQGDLTVRGRRGCCAAQRESRARRNSLQDAAPVTVNAGGALPASETADERRRRTPENALCPRDPTTRERHTTIGGRGEARETCAHTTDRRPRGGAHCRPAASGRPCPGPAGGRAGVRRPASGYQAPGGHWLLAGRGGAAAGAGRRQPGQGRRGMGPRSGQVARCPGSRSTVDPAALLLAQMDMIHSGLRRHRVAFTDHAYVLGARSGGVKRSAAPVRRPATDLAGMHTSQCRPPSSAGGLVDLADGKVMCQERPHGGCQLVVPGLMGPGPYPGART
jgi:hypothetical protein